MESLLRIFNESFNKYYKFIDVKTLATELHRSDVINENELSEIQRTTDENGRGYLYSLLVKDPSVRKLKAFAEVLKKDESKDNQMALARDIEEWLPSVNENVLLKKCWFPFGLHSLVVGPGGGDFPLDYGDSLLEVPSGAFEEEVVIRYGIALHGPWELPEGYTSCSVTVYLNLQGHHPNKELTLHLSNWYGGKERDGVKFVRAPHVLKGESKYQFILLEEGDFSDVRRGKLKIGQPLCLYAVALRDLDKKERFQVNAAQRLISELESCEELRVLFSHKSCNWTKVFRIK